MKTLIYLLSLICISSLAAQNNVSWVNCTSGLNVQDAFQTDTHLWIATTGGLVQRDLATGDNTYFNRGNSDIPSNMVTSVKVDADGLVWASTTGGLVMIDNGNWTIIEDRTGYLELAENGQIVFTDGRQLSYWDGLQFNDIQIDSDAVEFMVLSDFVVEKESGAVWFSYYTFGEHFLLRYQGNEWTSYDHTNSPIPWAAGGSDAFLADRSGRLWVGYYSGLYRWDGNQWAVFDSETTSLPAGAIQGLAQSADDRIWALIGDQLVEIIDDNTFESHDLPDELKTTAWFNFLQGFQNTDHIFVGSIAAGFWGYDAGNWTFIPSSQSPLISNNINQIFLDDDRVWMTAGKRNGYESKAFFRLADAEWTFFTEQNTSIAGFSSHVRIVSQDVDEGLWVHHRDSLYLHRDGDWTTVTFPDLVSGIDESDAFIHFDMNGNRWLLERGGRYIFHEQGADWIHFLPAEHGVYTETYSAIFNHPVRQDLWVSSYNGISVYNGVEWRFIRAKDVIPLANYNDITDMVVTSDGVVWASSRNYLLRIEDDIVEWVNGPFTPLLGGWVYGLALDAEENLWVGLTGAIAKFDGQDWTIFDNQNSGVPNGAIVELEIDAHGNVWIGSEQGGFAVYNENGVPDYLVNEGHNTSVTNPVAAEEITVYPNPVANGGGLHVELPREYAHISTILRLYSIEGKLLLSQSVEGNGTVRISSEDLPSSAGMYLLSSENQYGVMSQLVVFE